MKPNHKDLKIQIKRMPMQQIGKVGLSKNLKPPQKVFANEQTVVSLTKFKTNTQIKTILNVDETTKWKSSKKIVSKQVYSSVFLPQIEHELICRILLTLELGFRITSLTLRNIMKLYFDRTGQKVERFRYNIPTKEYLGEFLTKHDRLFRGRIGPGNSRLRFYSEVTKNSIAYEGEVKFSDHLTILDHCFSELFVEMGNADVKCL